MSNQQSLHSSALRLTPISDSRLQAWTPSTYKNRILEIDSGLQTQTPSTYKNRMLEVDPNTLKNRKLKVDV